MKSSLVLFSAFLALLMPLTALAGDVTLINIMTYNIFWGGHDTEEVMGRNEEWLQVIKSRNPEILVIEEANGWLPEEEDWISVYVDSLNAAFPNDPPYTGFVGDASSPFNVAFLTRLPVINFEWFNDVFVDGEWVHINHVFIHAELDDLLGHSVHVIGVHFKPGVDRVGREAEGRALLEIVDGIPPGETIWVVGDFNSYSPVDIDPDSPTQPDYGGGALPAEEKGWEPILYLLEAGFEDAFRTLHPEDNGYTQGTEGFYGLGPIQRVDFIMRSPSGVWSLLFAETVTDGLADVATDHYAVHTWYEFDPISSAGDPEPSRPLGLQTWPNPSSGDSNILFTLVESSPIRVAVYSPTGRLVRTLLDAVREPGRHLLSWDGRDEAGRLVSDGKYFVRVTGDGGVRSADVLRVK